MKKLIPYVIMGAGAMALAGCGASVVDVVGTGAVNGTNGLPFASGDVTGGGTLSTAVTGRTASTSSVSFAAGSGGGSFQQNSITVVGVDAKTISVTQNGEISDLKNAGQTYDATIDNVRHVVGVSQQGTAVSTYEYGRIDFENPQDSRIIRFVIGNDTNPANLIGTASYAVQLKGTGNQLANGTVRSLSIDGDGTINANFATTAVNGNLTVRTRTSGVDGDTARNDGFSLTGTLSGAGFTANATRTDCLVAEACVSKSTLSGNFYGQTGGEIAGIGVIDETATSTTGLVETKGSFTFIGAQ
ncbi:MAG: transferrin-binding protein-like solute binding protein [Proteobacteria bacterium]|nr:transferrin-binding protein-like solute binding protein [Pseudomonadota bacterium]MDA1155716.1 transferrin-binding protein-like solute binding protein [Pseudomonadota bacterium]